ncbi:putative Mg(2+) transport ATPase [Antarctobacter heliothermus]|uniref:Protein MgtC n=1 Tax=Antarctobacter heliothermus TaxID=74033 RepID=A0A222E907_9RHOB|nr:MgtC/SapB family protein [Antarctobacter heliothermus]ASP22685.1 putative Mg(2+) transport ATPase [Antarctobacter heliothermus]MBT52963.1 MgtC/SapB transporter [Mameliella sp.]|tara:strand:- start:17512 stop:17994 length:483 start_codon:yes stop_codon:yes gene_type:complete
MFESLLNEIQGDFSAVPAWAAFFRLSCALLLGAVIGIEREWRSKPAGLRTHILVAVAACLFVIIGQELSALSFGDAGQQRNDPLRMIEAVTAGVAFLAAGLIVTAQGEVRNITTGASLWLAGAVGLGCGAGRITLAAMATAMVVMVLALLKWVEVLARGR